MTIYSLDILLSQFATSSFFHVKFNLYAVYIMWYAGLDEAQAGIKIAWGNINNLRYADVTTLMTENEEELKSPLMKVKKQRKTWHKTQHSKNEDHGIQSHHFMANWWGNNGTSDRFYFLGLKNHCSDCSHENKRHLFLGRKTMRNLDSILKSRTWKY